ncbi:MAG TPA: NAD(P)H-binding protein, partial [Puia sp.]|nr:NAD(P)H-binding protein [Puia sp.]
MNIALIGAGYVGGEILKEAVNRGHRVTVIVRHPEKIASHPQVTAVKGDVFDVDGLSRSLRGHDAV